MSQQPHEVSEPLFPLLLEAGMTAIGCFLAMIAIGVVCVPFTFVVMILLYVAIKLSGVTIEPVYIVFVSYFLSGVILTVFSPSRAN